MKLTIAALGAKGIPHPGGIELVMEEIGSRLVQRGHRFDIFVRKHYMADKPIREHKGIQLPRSAGVHNKYLDAMSHSVSALAKILTDDYNVVYLNSVGLANLALIPKIARKKVVVHTHGLDWKREKWGPLAKRLLRASAWASVNLPDATFCVCREDKRFFENTYDKPCIYIPNGIPETNRRPPDRIRQWGLEEYGYLLFMARLVPEKGAHTLIEAWQKIPGQLKQAKKLVIAGDSNHKDRYYQSLMKYTDAPDIVFTGFATGPLKEELLSSALCFIQPSTIEGMPLSILEAMGYGRMILASDIQENLDVLGGHGWSFKSGNVDDLSSKIVAFLQAPRNYLIQQGESLFAFGRKAYDWEHIVDKVETVLTSLVRERAVL